MNIGILKEDRPSEWRISLSPAGVHAIVGTGHDVYVERSAGANAHFPDEEYITAGAAICYSPEEVINRSDVVLKISPPTEKELGLLTPGQTFFSSLHLAISSRKVIETLLERKITAVAYELIEDDRGDMPILQVMSEIGGQLSMHVAAHYLQGKQGGRGILLGSVPGIPSASVAILGAGTVGRTAARIALGLGASVILLDRDLTRLRETENLFHWRVFTAVTTEANISKAVREADVVIGAVLLKGARAPHVVTEEMVRSMRPGSVIVDVSIDQGGCVETSRPTTIEDPIFVRHGVVHYCVPNMPAIVARTATLGWTNAILPYLLRITELGMENMLRVDRGLVKGVCTYNGSCTNAVIARAFDLTVKELQPFVTGTQQPSTKS
jgi:alanine dehydrogenase